MSLKHIAVQYKVNYISLRRIFILYKEHGNRILTFNHRAGRKLKDKTKVISGII